MSRIRAAVVSAVMVVGLAYVSTARSLHAFDPGTGAERWDRSVTVEDDPYDNQIQTLALRDPVRPDGLGQPRGRRCGRWLDRMDNERDQRAHGTASGCWRGGVTGAADGTLAAYPAAGCGASTCASLWSASTGSRITGAPAISLGKVFVGTDDGRIIAYGPSSASSG